MSDMPVRQFASICLALLFAMAPASRAAAQDNVPPAAASRTVGLVPEAVVTHHRGVFGGKRMSYSARAGDTILRNEQGEPAATIFSVSYVADQPASSSRPVIFVFNGGPGSSSAWLHMGALGPKRVRFPEINASTSGPFEVIDNTTTPLDIADMVFIDPVGTGYSRILKGGKPGDYFGNDADAASIAAFIQRWLADNGRWNSPKFLFGESYGTTRAVLTARKLMGGVGSKHFPSVAMNGIVLIGQFLSYASVTRPANDLAYTMLLPSYAATAWHYDKVDHGNSTFDQFVARAGLFAREEYLPALYDGAALAPERKRDLARRMSALIGIPADELMRRDLRLGSDDFALLLLRDDDRRLGRYDTRFFSSTTWAQNDEVGDDPSMIQTGPPMAMTLLQYMRDTLKVSTSEPYEVITWQVGDQWNRSFGDAMSDYAEDLSALPQQNPGLHLFIGSGWFDLVTPVGAAEHMMSHARLPADRTEFHQYPAGHMLYYGDAPVKQFHADIRQFLARSMSVTPRAIGTK